MLQLSCRITSTTITTTRIFKTITCTIKRGWVKRPKKNVVNWFFFARSDLYLLFCPSIFQISQLAHWVANHPSDQSFYPVISEMYTSLDLMLCKSNEIQRLRCRASLSPTYPLTSSIPSFHIFWSVKPAAWFTSERLWHFLNFDKIIGSVTSLWSCPSVGWSVRVKGRKVTLKCSYRSTYYLCRLLLHHSRMVWCMIQLDRSTTLNTINPRR